MVATHRIAGLRGREAAARLAALVAGEPRIEHLADATAVGIYEDRLVGVTQGERGDRFVRVRASQIVVATGRSERPMLFRDNDRPGVMLASGALRLARLQRVLAASLGGGRHRRRPWLAPGRGADHRRDAASTRPRRQPTPTAPSRAEADGLRQRGVEIFRGARPVRAIGRSRVSALRVALADGTERDLETRLVAIAGVRSRC